MQWNTLHSKEFIAFAPFGTITTTHKTWIVSTQSVTLYNKRPQETGAGNVCAGATPYPSQSEQQPHLVTTAPPSSMPTKPFFYPRRASMRPEAAVELKLCNVTDFSIANNLMIFVFRF